jgi:hypothetical protein
LKKTKTKNKTFPQRKAGLVMLPWNKNNHFMETRLLPSNDDRDKTFSGPLRQAELR